jgi:predicted nucleotidyltransferase
VAGSPHRRVGRILKVVLFGSYARGGWVEDRISGYRSDYDLLIVVNDQAFTDLHGYWAKADERFVREQTVTHNIRTPVNFIVHALDEVNDQLARGRPFFSDIARDGIMLYEAPGHPLAKPKDLTEDEMKAEARGHYKQWLPKASYSLKLAEYSIIDKQLNHAAFNLHQTVEALYHCTLLVLTLYSPKLHRINVLRSQAERLDIRLQSIPGSPSDPSPACNAPMSRPGIPPSKLSPTKNWPGWSSA